MIPFWDIPSKVTPSMSSLPTASVVVDGFDHITFSTYTNKLSILSHILSAGLLSSCSTLDILCKRFCMFFTIVDSTNDLHPCLKILATSSVPKLTSIHFTSSRNMWYCYLIIEPFTVSLSLFSDLFRYDNYPSLQDIFITCEFYD